MAQPGNIGGHQPQYWVAHKASNTQLGYLPLDAEGIRLLSRVISEGYEKRRLIITTNLALSRWGTVVFSDDNMAAAIINRLMHH